MSDDTDAIRINWKVTHQYERVFTEAEMVEVAEQLRCEPDADSIHEALDGPDWRGGEWMIDNAQDRNWVDTDAADARVSDVTDLREG